MFVVTDDPLTPLQLFVTKCTQADDATNNFFDSIHEETVDTMPQPHNSLLIHNSTMTPTLEKFHNCVGRLRVHHQSCTDNVITRWITMHKYTSGTDGELIIDRSSGYDTMEFACINIYLNNLPAALHGDLIAGSIPLGTLLHKHDIQQECRPRYFFRMDVRPDSVLADLLEVSSRLHAEPTSTHHRGASWRCYGRCNTIYTPDGSIIAQVVEILP